MPSTLYMSEMWDRSHTNCVWTVASKCFNNLMNVTDGNFNIA